jgi:hypothetical protein
MKKRLKYLKTFESLFSKKTKKYDTWDNTEIGFKINPVLVPYIDKDITGEQTMIVTIDNFFTTNSSEYFENLLLLSRIDGFISDEYKIINHDKTGNTETISGGNINNVYTIVVDVIDWYEFLHTLDDGHLIDFKLI